LLTSSATFFFSSNFNWFLFGNFRCFWMHVFWSVYQNFFAYTFTDQIGSIICIVRQQSDRVFIISCRFIFNTKYINYALKLLKKILQFKDISTVYYSNFLLLLFAFTCHVCVWESNNMHIARGVYTIASGCERVIFYINGKQIELICMWQMKRNSCLFKN